MKKSLLALLLIVILFASCAKETLYLDNTGAGTPAVPGDGSGGGVTTGVLLGTKWKITSIVFSQEVSGVKNDVDLFGLVDVCKRDDLYSFNASDAFIASEGASSCAMPLEGDGTWKLSSDKKKLTIKSRALNDDEEPVIYDLIQLDNTNLKISIIETTEYEVGGQKFTMKMGTIITFKKA